ncbi:DUF4230 domain-containing protein [Holdemanella biformis]|uniref:DUF4230 domain-containing protein n=1 Tax=Holdemanella biformis TaxID=1735 RepID=UPI00266F941A|nr:DUF4230 domain-containing protein [Holdemanella biformis]
MKTLLSILKGIKNGLTTAFRKVKSSKRLQGALVLVCIVAIASTALFIAYKNGTKVNETIQETVVNYQDIEEITFQEATVPKIGVIHKPMELGKLEFDNPLTTSDCIFTYNITVKAGYDLKDIKDDGGNELTQTITVTLPKATVYEPYVDEDSFTKYWDDEKITANVGLDDIHAKKLEMMEHAKEAAIKGGLYEKTAEHAKVVIADYIHSPKGYENYNVVFNEEA